MIDSKLNTEVSIKTFSTGSSTESGTTLNCFNPSTEMTLLLQQFFLANWSWEAVFFEESQHDLTFEKTAMSTILDPQKWVSILKEKVDRSTKSANAIEKTLWGTDFFIKQS